MSSDVEPPGSDKNTVVIAPPLSIRGTRKIKMGNPIDAAWFNSNLVSASLIRDAGFFLVIAVTLQQLLAALCVLPPASASVNNVSTNHWYPSCT